MLVYVKNKHFKFYVRIGGKLLLFVYTNLSNTNGNVNYI